MTEVNSLTAQEPIALERAWSSSGEWAPKPVGIDMKSALGPVDLAVWALLYKPHIPVARRQLAVPSLLCPLVARTRGWEFLGNTTSQIEEECRAALRQTSFPRQPALELDSETSEPPEYTLAYSGDEVTTLFAVAKGEVFEDGMESSFSRSLRDSVLAHGDCTVLECANLIMSERVDPDVASEALRLLGRMAHAPTYNFRLYLLRTGLSSSSALVRDGALVGLSLMDDAAALPSLSEAVKTEKVRWLKRDMQRVIEQLRRNA